MSHPCKLSRRATVHVRHAAPPVRCAMSAVSPKCARHACAENERVLPQEGEAGRSLNIPEVFGATVDDANELRIVSLYEARAPHAAPSVSQHQLKFWGKCARYGGCLAFCRLKDDVQHCCQHQLPCIAPARLFDMLCTHQA